MMTRNEFRRLPGTRAFCILDVPPAFNLQKAGMPVSVCPELWIAGTPAGHTQDLQRQFVNAGSPASNSMRPTFTQATIKLAGHGLEDRLKINTRLVVVQKRKPWNFDRTGRQRYDHDKPAALS